MKKKMIFENLSIITEKSAKFCKFELKKKNGGLKINNQMLKLLLVVNILTFIPSDPELIYN